MTGTKVLALAALVACGFVLTSRASPLDPERYLLVEAEPRAQPEDYRLNDDVWPTHYEIEIKPYIEAEAGKQAFTFDGNTKITVTTEKQGVTLIKLHMARMDISAWSVVQKSDNSLVQTLTQIYDSETEVLTLPLANGVTLQPNTEYVLSFTYVGNMDEDMHGFYRSYYLVNGVKVWLGSTQFQQTHARRAFPCFDEPRFKATFQLKINHKTPQYNVYSNTPIVNTAPSETGRTLTTFGMTPSMSSYLLAFIVAPYEVNQRENMGILARPQAQNQTQYSLDEGIKVLKALGDWIDYPYSNVPEMTRMYMAAVPDFSAGAMENWGLLTYRETNILYRSDDSTSLQQQRIAAVIAHEIAHQWFGDLLTCEWWDVTWLNEGFARYYQFFGTALVEPSWDLEHQFVVEQLQGVMQMDSLTSTHPMTHPVYTQSQVSGIFDNISYNKGAVVLRMMEHFMTPSTFQAALRAYVKERQYTAVRPEHLFEALNRYNPNVRMYMEPWTVQSGFPLVTVTSNANGFTITQKRFLVNEPNHSDATLWPLPLTYATKAADFANTNPTFVMTASHEIPMANAADVEYFILNNQQVGYYRVNYDAVLWGKISKALHSENFGGIHVLNRAQLVDDLFNLARGDVVPYDTALEILEYLKHETEYAPWLAAVNGLTTLSRRIHEEDEDLFAIHILDIFAKAYETVMFKAPSATERRVFTYMRQNVLQWACNYGHEACSKAAVAEFERFYQNPSVKVHPDLRQVVYCEGIRKGTKAHFEFLWNQYLSSNMATEQILILQGMGCASTYELISIMMDAISSENIRSQDKSNAYTYVINNLYTLPHVSRYLQMNHATWAAGHGSYMNVASAFNNLLARLRSDTERDTISAFIETNKNTLGQSAYDSIKNGLADYETNKQFTLRNRDEIHGFLKKKADGGAATVFANMALIVSLLVLVVCRWMMFTNVIALAAIVACSFVLTSRASPLDPERYLLVEAEPRAQPEDYRLNDDVWPTHYEIEIKPYIEAEAGKQAFTFDGNTKITVTTEKQGVTLIKLHMARMDISAWSVVRKSDNSLVQTLTQIYDSETEVLTLPLANGVTLQPNTEYVLSFTYVGNMDDDMAGFYRSYYLLDGAKVWLGSTQFEQTDARRAFPSFDEPRFKATFQLKINHKTPQYNVYSNTPIVNTAPSETGRTLTTFGITPKMSTYLLAFIVAPYEVNQRENMGILARPQAQNQTQYSLDEGIKVLQALDDWADYPYSNVPEMTRMYMAAVPDFSAGAMENWGLLTYREANILFRSDDSSTMQQQRIATVISHEIAHQWFGDLLTCEWWDVAWLNEGFARYCEYFATALVEPSWDLEHQFVVEQVQSAMQMDSLITTHPMTHPVYTQAQASSIFDNISYNKGAVVLRMIEHLMTPSTFLTAIRAYIKENAYKSVRPDHLFNTLNRYNPNVRMYMEPWTVQSGFPLVTVTSNTNGFTITQKRFLVNEPNHSDATLWPLPLTYATKAADFANTNPTFVMTASHEIPMANATDVEYFILNNQQVGYYRVNYDAVLWGKISKALHSENFGGIHVLNRAQLVDDLFNLARGDVVPYDTALEILEYLKHETEYAPWLAAVNGLTTLSRRIHEEDEDLFAIHILDIFAKAYETVMFQAPSATERRVFTYMRQNVLQWACNYGHEACSKAAVAEFERFYQNPSVKVHPDLRQVVYCEGARKGTKAHFEFLWNQYLSSNVATEQLTILRGMGCASTYELISIMMDAIASEHIRSQDKSNAYLYIINNQYNLPHASNYLQQNHAIWAAGHGSYLSVASAFNNLLARLKSDTERDTISAFIETNKNTLGQSAYDSIKNGLAEYETNKQFTLRNRDEINGFLKKKADGGAATVFANMALIVSLVMLVVCRW
ncbi:uncharacterized protein LOC131284057 [Anopheles ziemanni]|uniref:uncharacterized protein LOC131260776 n=1 Tax=Anopheles coustani TaxID=139045 RepID=UPI002659247E|nr:uncharacterized protein LOC131260776 [Anopheles coustani]XP_058168895.1 uncharacterized protein LOC131284057 [Anopheles ziemanni]